MPSLDYAALAETIADENWWFDTAQLHGMLSALCAFGHSRLAPELLAQPQAEALINKLLADCESRLQDSALSYRLLLNESDALSLRAQSLAEWCRGFVLAYEFIRQHSGLSIEDENIRQIMDELAAFADLDSDIDDSEDNARQLNDLEEHCRLSVLMIYAEYHR